MSLEVIRELDDGSIEVYRPHRYKDGFYRVEVRVRDLEEVERLAREGASVRMKDDVTGQLNLVKPKKVV